MSLHTLLGVRSNLGFLRKALAHPVLAAGLHIAVPCEQRLCPEWT